MAKVKKFSIFPSKKNSRRAGDFQFSKKPLRWFKNKIKEIKKITKPQAKRLSRLTKKFGSLGIVLIVATALIVSFFSPKNQFQQTKENLVKNPNDIEYLLVLTEDFLKNNQFEEAEKILHLVEKIPSSKFQISKIERLWQQKHYSDPKDIQKLISGWEKIMEKYPNYRDGWLQLAFLNYKISEEEKAKENLQKALDLDPNFGPTRELGEIIN